MLSLSLASAALLAGELALPRRALPRPGSAAKPVAKSRRPKGRPDGDPEASEEAAISQGGITPGPLRLPQRAISL